MPRIPDLTTTATPPVVARLADLAPDYAPRVTVADKKDGHGLVRALHPTTGKRHARAVEDFPFVDLCTEGTGRGPGGLLWALIVDMDHDDSLLRIFAADVPRPSWIIEKGRNGHAQAGWIIEAVALGPNARQAPQDYAEDVRAALTLALGGDPQFRNRRAWNPSWTGWATEGKVFWGPTQPRSLGALKAEMTERGTWPAPEARRAARDTATARTLITEATTAMQVREGERNCFVFDMARTRKTGPVAEAAAAANALCTPPLPAAEVAGIVRSIERWEARTGARSGGTGCGSTAWSAIQAQRGRTGGSRGTQAQRIQRVNAAGRATAARSRRALARAKEARRQARRGWTTARIAAHFGVDRRTVRRWLNTRPRKTIQRADISGASGYPRAPHWPSYPLPHTSAASPRSRPRSTAPPPAPSPL